MSHTVILKALEFVATVERGCADTHDIFTLLTTQRQLLNSLAPILTDEGRLLPTARPESFFCLLMRADTFRFATSLYVGGDMNTSFVKEILGKMDCVISVVLQSNLVDDELTPTLLALLHLERVAVSYRGAMSYHGTLRPLLKHPCESVRRSVAVSSQIAWFRDLSTSDFITAFRDDIIPLIDSASCNGAVVDYIFLAATAYRWNELPRDIIMMLGERLFQFLTAENSHSKLVDTSLKLLGNLAAASVRGNANGTCDVIVDVFKEWPALELLSDIIRSGLVSEGWGIWSVIRSVFDGAFDEVSKLMRHHQQRFFELHVADVIYDAYSSLTGTSPLQRAAMHSSFALIAETDPISLLLKTNVLHKQMQQMLIPWHCEVRARMGRMKRRGERVLGDDGEFAIDRDQNDFPQRTAGARLIVREILRPILRRHEPQELSQVLRLLFDEEEGLNVGPVLLSYMAVYRNVPIVIEFVQLCRHAVHFERSSCIERRRGRDECQIRCYLAEFLESLDAMS